ncbi:DUF1931 domain-containing protein [Candidatus Woesearchaeota archaeon]|nr:DUF1931 domain-containing protein [Candidatus Woesearchaeota archaeon]
MPSDMLIIKSKIKEIAGDINVGTDVAYALDKKAKELLKAGVERAKANSRRTVMGKDI